ncbi:MAG: D-alanine--D-alanine ligase [Phycisphaerae bacterium]|nr:MAG: D-alanine--D-alanine ligase [Phycisphaerae bacterium]
MASPVSVLVLGGGPDAEREVSLMSSRAVAEALASDARFTVRYEVIGRITAEELRSLPGDVVFPVLHGAFGEGGPLQDLLEADGRAYVGSGPGASRLAMDKMGTKLSAAREGVRTCPACVLNAADPACPLPLPVVVKPIHEGSSVGVHICRDEAAWRAAREAAIGDTAKHPGRVYMVESAVLGGREVTVGLLDGAALAPIEIKPATEFYDYEAKYLRDDTRYDVDPSLPGDVGKTMRRDAERLGRAMALRHMARVDFLVDRSGVPWMLEVNTIPGFTSHSLLPKAAAHAGLSFTGLCTRLVELALRDAAGPR